VTDRLNRELAPISAKAWEAIDEEASRSLRHYLTARSLVDFSGPKGWDHHAEADGTVDSPSTPAQGVEVRARAVHPLQELRATFSLARSELERVDRGYGQPDLDPLTGAARAAASAENRAIFDAVAGAAPHEPVTITGDYNDYPGRVAQAVAVLRRAGVGGPYGIALGDRCYTGVIETTEHGGYPVLEHVRLIVEGPVVWAPDVDGALVMSVRGGDYELVTGSDFAVGYSSHSKQSVELYLEESLVFLVHEQKAAVALRYAT
jgi:uncharacterized linocin/CFP29 family protein